jgi:hypothetical protein
MTPDPQPVAAACAVHPDRVALRTCPRCGNYACDLCTEGERHEMCGPCRQRLGLVEFPFARDRWSFDGLVGYGWHVFKREWQTLVLAALIFVGISLALSFASQMGSMLLTLTLSDDSVAAGAVILGFTVVSSLLEMAVQGWLALGFFALAFRALSGQPLELKALFTQHRKVLRLLVQYLVMFAFFGVAAGIPTGIILGLVPMDQWLAAFLITGAVLAVPVMYVALGLSFMQAELVYDDEAGPLEAIRRSWVIVRGHRLWAFVGGLVYGLAMFVGLLACCVGMLATMPFAHLVYAALYLALRNGAEVPAVSRQAQGPSLPGAV